MTDRQKALIAYVQPYLSDAYRTASDGLKDEHVGHSVTLRYPLPFVPGRRPPFATLTLHVQKAPDGLRFRVNEPLFWRKGQMAPKWRRLHA